MIQSSQISVHSKSVSAHSPYIRFEGVVELCSQLWLVVAVRQWDIQKGSIIPTSWKKWMKRIVCGFVHLDLWQLYSLYEENK